MFLAQESRVLERLDVDCDLDEVLERLDVSGSGK